MANILWEDNDGNNEGGGIGLDESKEGEEHEHEDSSNADTLSTPKWVKCSKWKHLAAKTFIF